MSRIWLQRGEAGFAAVEAFISERIWGAPRVIPGETIMAVTSDDALIGAAIYQNYSSEYGTIEMSAAADSARWMTRDTLFELYAYPFQQLGCQAVIKRCDPDNTRLDRIFKAYGFKRYDLPRLRGRDKAEAIYILGDDDWRANGFHKELTNG